MFRIRLLLVTAAIALLSASAMAETGPCSAGIQDPPIFALVADNPVRLTFRDTTQAMLSLPVVTIDGNDITVVQLDGDANHLPVVTCNSQSVSLGDLPAGSYAVTWKYQAALSNVFFETFSFAFTLPAASPCVAGISIQPGSPAVGQAVSILYSATFRGFLQTPDVAIDGNQITIAQSAVIADPAFPGHVPCARGIVQIGGLRPGYYPVEVRSNSGAPMFDAFTVPPLPRRRAVR
jgi:hypothetical protein